MGQERSPIYRVDTQRPKSPIRDGGGGSVVFTRGARLKVSADCEKGVREVIIEIYVPLGWGK